jgi:hypothetical protein
MIVKLTAALLAVLVAIPMAAPAQAIAQAELDPQHRELARLVGTWSVRQSFWKAPGQAPKIDPGTADFAMVLNRRHLRQTLHIADGTNFEGLGYIGYDNGSRQFFSTWMDASFPGLVLARGGFDEAAKAYVFRGAMDSAPGAPAIPVREVMTITDRDHFTYEYFETHDGSETLTVRLEYSRSG